MRRDFGVKTWLYPQPVLVIATYGADGTPDAMCAAWGGISDDTQLSVCVAVEHKSAENFAACGAFTVSMATAAYVEECDYLGVVSGNDVPDKLARSGLHVERAGHVNAPLISELPSDNRVRAGELRPGELPLGGRDSQRAPPMRASSARTAK